MGRLSLILPGLLLLMSATHADEDHERARQLVDEGRILPLEQLLERFGERQPGRLLEVELEEKKGRYLYELEFLEPDGEVREYYIDAASGEVVKEEGPGEP